MIDTVLCVDIGTTSLKAGLISADGEVVFISVQHFNNSEDRFIANSWKKALKSAVQEIKSKKIPNSSDFKICAISISGNGPTVVLESGLTFRWNDDVSFLDKTFPSLKNEHSLFLPRILGLCEKFKAELSESKWIFSGPEFLIYELTKKAVTVLPEIRFETAYWNENLLLKYNLPSKKMPPYVPVAQICGFLQDEIADELSLPRGIPVTSGGPDFTAALIGTKTLQSGNLCDRCGSSEGFNFASSVFLQGEKVRSLPSVIKGLWNASVLIPNSANLSKKERLEAAKNAIEVLRELASKNGIPFPKKMIATGGQAKDTELLREKSEITNMKITVCQCADAELLGDACAGFTALKKYPDLISATKKIVKETEI